MVTLPQRKVRYYEAVTRLRDDKDQVLAAEDFIGVAEAAGLIGRIDHMVMLRCVQVLRRLMVRNKDVGVFCNVAASTLGNTAMFSQCLDFLDANRALAPSFVLEFKQATFRNLGPTETEHLAALAQRGYRFSIDHVTRSALRAARARRPRRALHQGAGLAAARPEAELDLRHPSVRPLRPARPLRHRPDRREDRGRTRRGRPARLRRPLRPGLSVRAAAPAAAGGRARARTAGAPSNNAQEINGDGQGSLARSLPRSIRRRARPATPRWRAAPPAPARRIRAS